MDCCGINQSEVIEGVNKINELEGSRIYKVIRNDGVEQQGTLFQKWGSSQQHGGFD